MTSQLDSSFLREATFNQNTGILTVVFNNGTSYSYSGVDETTYRGFVNAHSSSRFYTSHIRNSFQLITPTS